MTTKTIRTTICDQCGDKIDRKVGLTIQNMGYQLNDSDQGGATIGGYDLCPVCTHQFTMWIQGTSPLPDRAQWLGEQLKLAHALDQGCGGTAPPTQVIVGMKRIIREILAGLEDD